VDGTARLQVVAREQNERLWSLLTEFETVSGVPVLLNTSFNNHAEPIVQSVDDVVTTFITTGLDLLAIGPYLVRRRDGAPAALAKARLELMPFCRVAHEIDRLGEYYEIFRTARPTQRFTVSAAVADLLGGGGISEITADEDLIAELWRLWDRRLIRVLPGR
jgi:hypothetical protein